MGTQSISCFKIELEKVQSEGPESPQHAVDKAYQGI